MPLMKQSAVVPFGKYKGQPVAQLAADQEYCQWLVAQPWFIEKFAHIHTLIINNFGEPSETPEHNRLQLRFLEETFRRQCMRAIFPRRHINSMSSPTFEVDGLDVVWDYDYWYVTQNVPQYRRTADDPYVWCSSLGQIGIECKPSLGDDYPAVLRTIQRIKPYTSKFVVAGEVRSQAGSLAQIKAFFRQSNIGLLTVAEIEAAPPVAFVQKSDLPPPGPKE